MPTGPTAGVGSGSGASASASARARSAGSGAAFARESPDAHQEALTPSTADATEHTNSNTDCCDGSECDCALAEEYYSCNESDDPEEEEEEEGYSYHRLLQQYAPDAGPSKRRPQSLYAFPTSTPATERPRRPASVISARTLPRRARSDWHVRAANPTIGIEDREASAELSSLAMPNGQPNKRSSWGGSLINGAVSAAVFSAAVGLTAYRLWRGWDDGDDGQDGPHADDDGDAYMRKPPMPGVYEPDEGEEAEPVHDWENHYDSSRYGSHLTPPRRPASEASSVRSPPSTRRRNSRRKRAQRPSIAELVVATARAQGQHRALGSPGSTTSMSITTGAMSEISRSPLFDTRTLPDEIQEEEESDDEMNSRLDEMARRLQTLISEGERALAAQASPPGSASPETPYVDTEQWRNLRLRSEERELSPETHFEPMCASGYSASAYSTLSIADSVSRRHSARVVSAPARTQETPRRSSISSIPRPRPQSIRGTPGTPTPLPFPTSPDSGSLSSVPESRSPTRDRRSSSGSWTRGLPPLPWRRDPSGEPRWVQRPLSPSAPERSNTPVPPVPPIPPEHAVNSRPSSMIYLQKRNSTKRYSTPGLKLAMRKSKDDSPVPSPGPSSPATAVELGSPSPAPRRDLPEPPVSPTPAPKNHDPVSPGPLSPLSPVSPTSPRHASRPSSSMSSRIPRHIRAPSVAGSAASPPASPTVGRSRSSTVTSIRSPTNASSLPMSTDGSQSGRLSSMSSYSGTSGSRAATPATPAMRQAALDWRETPTSSSSRLRFARPVGTPNGYGSLGASSGSNVNANLNGSLNSISPKPIPGVAQGIVAARTAVYSASSSPERAPHTPPNRWQALPQTPGSAGSGRSRIPVRRSIDPDSFAEFGRFE